MFSIMNSFSFASLAYMIIMCFKYIMKWVVNGHHKKYYKR
jgi:hypothetical protein